MATPRWPARRCAGRRGGRTRPPGRISPMSSNTITPLHSRLHPCSGWMATVWAASRSGRSADGHGGQCGHIAHLWSGLRMYFVLWTRSSLGWSRKDGTNRRSLRASPEGAHAGGIFRSRPVGTTVPPGSAPARYGEGIIRPGVPGRRPSGEARQCAWHSADQRWRGRGPGGQNFRIQQRTGIAGPETARTRGVGGRVAAGQLGTVKKQVSHLLGKLCATNRTEAVTRARHLGLIP